MDADIESGKWGPPGDRSVVCTRFPPEPNGYLHVGHAKAIILNSGLADEFGGRFNLRFDDTNPAAEEQQFVDSITSDARWLTGHEELEALFASDYFGQLYDWACELIEKGLAYVDDQTAEEIREQRGSLTDAGTNSPNRDRDPAESLKLFAGMKNGEFENGSNVLRAKIDMASPNINLRDPVMYRIVNATHHRTGDTWHIYPMYDWAHGLEDSIEGITHSVCTLEFEHHRPLYDWFIDAINRGRDDSDKIHHPQQIEFARLNPSYIITSKRKLRQIVDDGHVDGWGDPRMPTVAGLRRRGYTSTAIKAFCAETGVTKFNGVHDLGLLEAALRDDLNTRAPRRMAVLKPLKVTITNWPPADHSDDYTEDFIAANHPQDESMGTRPVSFGKTIYVEQDDFMLDAPKKFFRLAPGREVRLRYAYWITCVDHVLDDDGNVVELRCTYDPQTQGGNNPPADDEGKVRKVKGTIHWVPAHDCVDAEVRQFDRLFTAEKPGKESGDPIDDLNPDSLEIITGAKVERVLASRTDDEPAWVDGIRRFQFERTGYFAVEGDAPDGGKLIFNRTATLRDSWAKKK
ncbi:MAG: glutaminyl-tRNA synthetase [Phycisphaerales bacterium]